MFVPSHGNADAVDTEYQRPCRTRSVDAPDKGFQGFEGLGDAAVERPVKCNAASTPVGCRRSFGFSGCCSCRSHKSLRGLVVDATVSEQSLVRCAGKIRTAAPQAPTPHDLCVLGYSLGKNVAKKPTTQEARSVLPPVSWVFPRVDRARSRKSEINCPYRQRA